MNMNVTFYKSMTYKELQSHFKKYLEQTEKENQTNSAGTYLSDGLYLLRKGGNELFWNTVTCPVEDFEKVAYDNLLEQLQKHSKSNNILKNIKSYEFAIKKFREFIYSG